MLQGDTPTTQLTVPIRRVKEIQRLNRKGKKPEKLITDESRLAAKELDTFHNVVGQEDLTRFDKPKNKRRKKRNYNRNQKRKPKTN